MSNPQDPRDDHTKEPNPGIEQVEGRRSGEGAASAMQQLISQNQQHRHLNGEADEAGGRGQ
ncbi:MAG TPA: hypothetical protein VEA35_17705 [Ramlibacter sp.]|nr:hypothetical protein [Ramlibacter sp.]